MIFKRKPAEKTLFSAIKKSFLVALLLNANGCKTTDPHNVVHRAKRQIGNSNHGSCSFEVTSRTTAGDVIDPCSYIIHAEGLSLTPWKLGTGSEANWIGGPSRDSDVDAGGGYAYSTMSDLLRVNGDHYSFMVSTPELPTDAQGKCLTFKYQISGLNTEELQVLLFTFFDPTISSADISGIQSSGKIILYRSSTIWRKKDESGDVWLDGSVSFISHLHYSIAFKAAADARYPSHRGYIAVDDVLVTNGFCNKDCQFDGGFCSWTNSLDKDFDWTLSRSSLKRGTGPSRDQQSSANSNLETGGYAYIDSSFPRKSMDKARLVSAEITATEMPLCLTFWVHMYGGGLGTLRILRQIGTEIPIEIWKQGGSNSLNRWNLGQLTLSANVGSVLRIIIEATVGIPGKGDIAIDTIIFKHGACPQLPHGSGVGISLSDCTFLVNECQWKLHQPISLISSTPMLTLGSGSYPTPAGHTQIVLDTINDKYAKYDLGHYRHRLRQSSYLISPTVQNNGEGICLSFWFYMYTNVPTENKVGALTVIISTNDKNTTVWRMQNQQHYTWILAQVLITELKPFRVTLKGTKGTKKSGLIGVDDITLYFSNCKVLPAEAIVSPQDCSFDESLCLWEVEIAVVGTTPSEKDIWRYASEFARSSMVYDHTFGQDKVGLVFIESFNSDISSLLVSSPLQGSGVICVTFYFASFITDGTAVLTISRRDATGNIDDLWQITQDSLPPHSTSHDVAVEWHYGQVSMLANGASIIIRGKVRRGGWAIDDIRIAIGFCEARPSGTALASATIEQQPESQVEIEGP